MNTIRVDKNYQNKLKIALPNSKRYRTRSADNIQAKLREEPRKPLVETKEPVNPSPVVNRSSIQSNSQKKIAVINPLERVADPDKNAMGKPTVKLPPIKSNAKMLPPAPIQTKIPVQPSPAPPYQRENIPARNPSSKKIAEDRDSSLSKNQTPHSRKYHDYLEKLIEQNNQYLKEKSSRNDSKQNSRNRVSSADNRRDAAPYSGHGNNKGFAPLWWG